MGDKSWVFEYDPKMKRQSMEWKEKGKARTKWVRMSKSKVKVMVIFFFDWQGIILQDFVPPWQTANAAYYIEVLKNLRPRILWKRPELWAENNWVLHHDNVPTHSALAMRLFLGKHVTTVINPPPPFARSCTLWLFPILQNERTLKRDSFWWNRAEDIKENCSQVFKTIPKEAYERYFKRWKSRMEKCIVARGSTLKGAMWKFCISLCIKFFLSESPDFCVIPRMCTGLFSSGTEQQSNGRVPNALQSEIKKTVLICIFSHYWYMEEEKGLMRFGQVFKLLKLLIYWSCYYFLN